MDLSDTTALVTGGAGGLGAIIAEHLAAQGTFVIIADLDADAAAATRRRIGRAAAIQADLTDETDRDALIAAVAAQQGPYVLVNNAGGWGDTQYPDATEAEWRKVLELNLLSPMALIQGLQATGQLGCVINISSSAAREPQDYAAPDYASAKAGLLRLTTALGSRRDGPRMNCIVPGWIALPRAVAEQARLTDQQRAALVDPQDIAREVVRLAADDSQSGQVSYVGC